LDDGTDDLPWPTFGFKLMEPDKRKLKEAKRNPIKNPISFLKAIVDTMLDAHDSYHISKSKGDYDRTIGIPTVIKISGMDKEIGTTDFNITREESQVLYENNVNVAKEFLKTWDFDEWKKKYRQKKKGS
jgi:NTE family protein